MFDFQNAAAQLFDREVDIVIDTKFRNPYFQEAVDESRELVYESASRMPKKSSVCATLLLTATLSSIKIGCGGLWSITFHRSAQRFKGY